MSTQKSLQKISVTLCLFLRHNPEAIHIELDSEGWTDIDQLIVKSGDHCPGLNRAMLDQIVAEDKKGRYGISADGKRIRCVQGHSTPVVNIKHIAKIPPPILYHWTAARFLDSIMKQGLSPQKRHYVHLSENPEATKHNKDPVRLTIDTRELVKQHVKFFQADNGVWLIDAVPPKYITQK